jgi:hypothetical protein
MRAQMQERKKRGQSRTLRCRNLSWLLHGYRCNIKTATPTPLNGRSWLNGQSKPRRVRVGPCQSTCLSEHHLHEQQAVKGLEDVNGRLVDGAHDSPPTLLGRLADLRQRRRAAHHETHDTHETETGGACERCGGCRKRAAAAAAKAQTVLGAALPSHALPNPAPPSPLGLRLN